MFGRTVFLLALALPLGCAIQPPGLVTSPSIEVAFSPEAGAEALVVKVLASAQQTIRLAGYSFTSPAVVKGLLDAKRRGVDVKVLLDDRGNRGQSSLVAMRMITEAIFCSRSFLPMPFITTSTSSWTAGTPRRDHSTTARQPLGPIQRTYWWFGTTQA